MFASVSSMNLAIKNINILIYAIKISPQWPPTTQRSLPCSLTFIRPCPSSSESSSKILQIFLIYICREISCQCGPLKKNILPTSPIVQWPTLHMGVSLPCCSPSFSDLAQFVQTADSKILHTFMNNCREIVMLSTLKTTVSQLPHSAVAHLAQGS